MAMTIDENAVIAASTVFERGGLLAKKSSHPHQIIAVIKVFSNILDLLPIVVYPPFQTLNLVGCIVTLVDKTLGQIAISENTPASIGIVLPKRASSSPWVILKVFSNISSLTESHWRV